MCVIIDRPAGVPIDEQILKTAINDNPDGWGWMYAEDGQLVCDWGMEEKEFFESYNYLPADKHATLHFRWTTHGLTNVLNCHPFLFNNDTYGVVHNGVIQCTIKHKELSDTYHFANGELSEALLLYGHAFAGPQHKRMRKYLEHLVGGYNKLIILRNDGERMYLNRKAGVSHKGLWLSNNGPLGPPLSKSTISGRRHYKSRSRWADNDYEGVDYQSYGGYVGGVWSPTKKKDEEKKDEPKVEAKSKDSEGKPEPKKERKYKAPNLMLTKSGDDVTLPVARKPDDEEVTAKLEEAAETNPHMVGVAVSAALGFSNPVDADYAYRMMQTNERAEKAEAAARKAAAEEDARDAALVAHYMALNEAKEDEVAAIESEDKLIEDYIRGRDRLVGGL